jgi:molybdopterin-containing oxidoreductase family membrane subunit
MKTENQASQAFVMGLFSDEDQAVSTIEDLKESTWKIHKVHMPIPNHKILDALKLKSSRVGYFTLAGGLIGFFAGLALAIFTATRWDLIVQGKPIVSLIPFFIVGFEFTILFSVFGNVIGLLTQAKLPEFNWEQYYDSRCSGSHIGIVASCEPANAGELSAFFKKKGAEIRTFD